MKFLNTIASIMFVFSANVSSAEVQQESKLECVFGVPGFDEQEPKAMIPVIVVQIDLDSQERPLATGRSWVGRDKITNLNVSSEQNPEGLWYKISALEVQSEEEAERVYKIDVTRNHFAGKFEGIDSDIQSKLFAATYKIDTVPSTNMPSINGGCYIVRN